MQTTCHQDCRWRATAQELAGAREGVARAQAVVRAGEAALRELDTAIPRARLEATAHGDRARDLTSRLSQLEAATQVHSPLGSAGLGRRVNGQPTL